MLSFLGTGNVPHLMGAAATCVLSAVTYVLVKHVWGDRGQRRSYWKRQRVRREYWGWE